MKIDKVRVHNFLSYKDSGEVELDKRITAMIGKNESGKTNFLKALESLNVQYKYSPEDLCYYSEEREKPSESIKMVTVWFAVENEDRKKLKEIWEKVARAKRIRITKFFDGKYYVEIEEPKIDLPEPRVKLKKGFGEEVESQVDTLTEKIDAHAKRYAPFADSKSMYEKNVANFLSIDFTDLDSLNEGFDLFSAELEGLPNQDNAIQKDIDDSLKELRATIEKSTEIVTYEEKILEIIPNFIYFDSILDLLDNTINISDFSKAKKKYKTFRRLTELANLNLESLATGEVFDRRFATEEASATITGMVNESWTQEKVEVKIGIDARDLYVYVQDESGGHDPPRKRSDGFQWFLSFYINFMAGSRGEFKNTILLLDNPGVYLHPSGQKDLLHTLEEIAKTSQIVFTTHSPFLIDRKHLNRVRIVSKTGLREGSTIKEKFHVSDFDALQPIRAAIGMTLGDALFGTKKNLIVEGYSDNLILEAVSGFCKRINKNHLGPKVSIVSVGSADRIPYYALLLSKEDLSYVVILDNDTKGRRVKKSLIEGYGIEKERIVTLDNIDPQTLKGIDLEIEDLIDSALYNRAVNEAYEEILKSKNLTQIDLKDLDATIIKQTKKYERFFRDRKLGGFDKILVAKQMYNILHDKESKSENVGKQTLNKFEKLFQIANQKLQ